MPLQRARTMPTARKGTASRMASTAKRAKAARSAGAAAKRQRSIVAKANREVKAAAIKAVMSLKEEKYFNVQPDQQTKPECPTTGGKKVSVAAFSTTDATDGSGALLTYCGHGVYPLTMLRPFTSTTGVGGLVANTIDGRQVTPSDARIGWTINRCYLRELPQLNTSVDNLYYQLPVRCRMTRVTPKLAAGVTTQIDPDTDLFRNQFGVPYSAISTDFTYSDAEYAQINTEVYTVLQDIKFTLDAPFSCSFDGISPNITPRIDHAKLPPTKKLVTQHQLTERKNGSVQYNSPDTDTNATTGLRREYIFFHFWFEAGDHGNNPAITGAGIVPDEDAIKLHFRPESRFKDS